MKTIPFMEFTGFTIWFLVGYVLGFSQTERDTKH